MIIQIFSYNFVQIDRGKLMIEINKEELKNLILGGITQKELKKYDYSKITDFSYMFYGCTNIEYIDEEWLFKDISFKETKSKYLEKNIQKFSYKREIKLKLSLHML